MHACTHTHTPHTHTHALTVIYNNNNVQQFQAKLPLPFQPCWRELRNTSMQILYKVACMCFSAINGSGPAYLSELLHVYTPSRTLGSSSDIRMLKIQQYKRKSHGFCAFSCFGPTFGIHSHKTLDTAQPCHLLKPNWKPSSSHSISIPTNINTQFLLWSFVCVCVCVCFHIIPYVNCFGRAALYMCI